MISADLPTAVDVKAKVKQVGGPATGLFIPPASLPGPQTSALPQNYPQDAEDSFLLSDYN
jgi:hypothetical protein